MLHNNTELFEQAVLRTSEHMGIDAGIIEKDYFVTLMLQEISSRVPDIVFKGGTSLSKCHKIINRFSEDIDLTVSYDEKPSEGKRRALKKSIISSIESLGFKLVNPDGIMSRREFNKYIVDYPSVFDRQGLKSHLQIETMIKIKSYPTEEMKATSLIFDFLFKEGYKNIISDYDMSPFTLKVQSAERTFIDKIFALADYYLSGRINEQSRHIYDLYKMLDIVELNEEFRTLYEKVRSERKPHKVCLSAQDNVDMKEILDEIVQKETYKTGYNNITKLLIFEELEYEEAVKALETVKAFL